MCTFYLNEWNKTRNSRMENDGKHISLSCTEWYTMERWTIMIMVMTVNYTDLECT